jgi:hypothetical protein
VYIYAESVCAKDKVERRKTQTKSFSLAIEVTPVFSIKVTSWGVVKRNVLFGFFVNLTSSAKVDLVTTTAGLLACKQLTMDNEQLKIKIVHC